MALINNATPADGDLIADGDDEIRSLKTAIQQIIGIPNNVNITAAGGNYTAGGLEYTTYQNSAANPTAAGRLQRNAANLLFHDGTAARTVLTSAVGAIALAGTLIGSRAGDYSTTSTTFVDVDATNLKTTLAIPAGARFLIAAAWFNAVHGGSSSVQIDSIQIVFNVSTVVAGIRSSGSGVAGNFPQSVLFGVLASPSGTFPLALQFRRDVTFTNCVIRNRADDALVDTAVPRLLYLVVM